MEMSGNSWPSALHTAPMVSDFWPPVFGTAGSAGAPSSSATSACQVRELVLADLQLVAVLEPVGVDPAPVDVGAVERAGVVEVPAVLAVDEDRVVAGHRDVVEEDAGLRGAADGHPVAAQREGLADPPAARADDECAAARAHGLDVDRAQLARAVVDDVGGRGGLGRLGRLGLSDE